MKYHKYIILHTLALLSFLISGKVNASGFYSDVGIHTGGDKLVNVNLTNNAGRFNIKTGDVLSVLIGANININESLSYVIGTGTRSNTAWGAESDIDWEMEELRISILYKFSNWQLGAGMANYFNPRLRGISDGRDISMDFEDTIAINADLNWYYAKYLAVGLTLTFVEFTQETTGQSFDGNSIGLKFTLLQ